MIPLISYEQFKQTETIKYGSLATSASANKAPLFLKSELNRLYNDIMIRFGEKPLTWDSTKTYYVGESVYYEGTVYTAIVGNINQKPPSSSWEVLNTSKYNLDAKYVLSDSNNYIKLNARDNYRLMSAGNDSTSSLMTPKNGIVPWDNGVSSSLGNPNLKFQNLYSVNSNFSSVNTNSITVSNATIENLTATTINVPSMKGTASNALKLNGLSSSYFMPQWNYISIEKNYTASNTDYIFVNTTNNPITVTLPATPSKYDVIGFLDVKGTFNKNNLTIANNGNAIMGLAQNMMVSTENMSFELIYINGDWRIK